MEKLVQYVGKRNVVLFSVLAIIFVIGSGNKLYRRSNIPPGFILGVNGHPLTQYDYFSVPVETQVKYMVDMGFSYYRIDAVCDISGTLRKEDIFFSLAKQCALHHIKILPVIPAGGYSNYSDSATAYVAGKRLTSAFAAKYGKYFDHYEIGNELDFSVLKLRYFPGKDTTDFVFAKTKIIAAYLDGMNAGIKTQSPNAKTIIDMGETHYGFISLMKRFNVHFDIIGEHFYLNKPFNQENDIRETNQKLAEIYKFTKPIWITEFNQAFGTAKRGLNFNREQSQKDIIDDCIASCKKIKYDEALFIYELFDEPALNVKPGNEFEKSFGVIKKESSNLTPKIAGKSLMNNKNKGLR